MAEVAKPLDIIWRF